MQRNAETSQLVLTDEAEVLGCCQVTIRRVPLLNLKIADVNGGPLWRRRGRPVNTSILAELVGRLKREYGVKRGCLMRVCPHTIGEEKVVMRSALTSQGFEYNQERTPYRTLVVDLSPSLDELRKNLGQKWRNQLNKAERNGLTVTERVDASAYGIFLEMAREMVLRKGFTPGVDYERFARVQQDLSPELKMRIFICSVQSTPICVAVCSVIGDTGVYVLGASAEKGKGLNGANLVQWRILQWLKERGVRRYDLGGIDPAANPGVYDFKLGIAGRAGVEEQFLGQFDGSFSFSSRLAQRMLTISKSLRRKS